jgi:ATP-dependent helicase STH1/SNF2
MLLSTQLAAKVADNAVKVQKASSEAPPTPSAQETPAAPANQDATVKLEGTPQLDDVSKAVVQDEDPDAPLYPFNAYLHPFTHLKVVSNPPEAYATRLQRLLVPSIMPLGLDPHQLLNERRRFVEARIQQRIHELEAMSSTIGDGGLEPIIDDESKENVIKSEQGPSKKAVNLDYVHPPVTAHGKLRAVIELKSLRVLDKQRALRAMVAERLTHGSLLPLNRSDFRRVRKPAMRDTHTTENLERKQRVDRERRAKQKHVEQLSIICAHGREVLSVNRSAQDRVIRLGKAVLSFHTHAEREEQKRIERISKERLKALKADDEEAYMKLIDTAKDTRITHLLKQTDTYLDSLAQAVLAQQTENPVDLVEEAASEETFGGHKSFDDSQEDKGKIDYYAVAHRIKEKVVKQPSLLVGGTLKDYQVKGLQWMVSLYNNRLNGILADEMVRPCVLMLRKNLCSPFQGLGKTIQTISLVTFLIEVKKQRGPYLVVVPLSTMTNWSGEFAKWAPAVKIIAYKGNPMQRRALQTELRVNQFQVLLTTYEYIIKDRPVLSKMKWVHMIIGKYYHYTIEH